MSGETFAEEISRIRPASVLIVLDSREKIAEHKRVFSALPFPIWSNPLLSAIW